MKKIRSYKGLMCYNTFVMIAGSEEGSDNEGSGSGSGSGSEGEAEEEQEDEGILH